MGGWISLVGNISDFQPRLKRFKRIFSLDKIPELRVKTYTEFPEMKLVLWAWDRAEIPDVTVSKKQDNLLVLSGVITDVEGLTSLSYEQGWIADKILEQWLTQGEKIIRRLNGSFSCLFYNNQTKEMSVFTDRFASRSVWMGKEDEIWTVGNFPSALVAFRNKEPKINPAGLWSLFHAGRQVGEYGLYDAYESLMAGQTVVLTQRNGIKTYQWWTREYSPDHTVSPYEWGYRIASELKNSVRNYKKVSKNPFLFLSGGINSRIVASAFKSPLRTLSVSSNYNAETRIASIVSKTLNLEHQTIIRSPYWYLDVMMASSLISSGNYLNKHVHFINPVLSVKDTSPDAEFLLGDLLENFNKHYFNMPKKNDFIFSSDNIDKILYSLAPYTMRVKSRFGIYFTDAYRDKLKNFYLEKLREYARSVMHVSECSEDRFDTFLRWANVGVTPTYNMITGIWPLAKERNLFFHGPLDDLSLKIPAALRGKGIIHKWILYNLDKKMIFIPDANTLLPAFTPNSICVFTKKVRPIFGSLRRFISLKRHSKIDLRTSGSWLFLHEMYRKDPRYKNQIESIIFDSKVFPKEIFDSQRIKRTWDEYQAGNISLHLEIEALRTFGGLNKLLPSNGFSSF